MQSIGNTNLTDYYCRKTIRLENFDYSKPGYYFVTVCINNRMQHLFGDINNDGKFVGTTIAGIVDECWMDLPNHYQHVALDEFVIMPNHVHGIIVIRDIPVDNFVGAGLRPAPTKAVTSKSTTIVPEKRHGLPEIIRAFKSFSSRRITETGHAFKWQRGFHDHVVRNKESLHDIRKYIRHNPLKWHLDPENHFNQKSTGRV